MLYTLVYMCCQKFFTILFTLPLPLPHTCEYAHTSTMLTAQCWMWMVTLPMIMQRRRRYELSCSSTWCSMVSHPHQLPWKWVTYYASKSVFHEALPHRLWK